MSLPFWIPLTDLPETSSGGLLPQSFIKPWNPEQLNNYGAFDKQGYLLFFGTVNSAGGELSFWVGEGEKSVKRLLGCAMLAMMPEEGMDEALQSLKDILEFWHHPTQRTLPSMPTIHHKQEEPLFGANIRDAARIIRDWWTSAHATER